jgi:hypothetical protein
MAKPFISAFHDGSKSVDSYIKSDQLIYWYRPTPRGINCDLTDTTLRDANNGSGNYFKGRPNGWETMQDSVFVVALLTQAGTVTVTSGSKTSTFSAPAGASTYTVDMQLGQQSFSLSRSGQTVLSATSLKVITDVCPCGLYNFNAYVGTVPESPSDPLKGEALASLVAGLIVQTCVATPSLPTAPVPPVTTTTPGGGGGGPITTTTPGNGGSGPSTTTTTSNPPPPAGTACVAGTGPGNYVGLCQYSCQYNVCPSPCTCTAFGNQASLPPSTGTPGYPLPGEADDYKPLCSFTCGHGYCPATACSSVEVQPGQVCVAGTGPGNYVGLCQFACQYGVCPGPCSCTSWGSQAALPPKTSSTGYPLPGEPDDYKQLCDFTCSHGYCPGTACSSVPPTTNSNGQVCVAGTGPGNYIGLCQYACQYGLCPSPCTCTAFGSQASLPGTTGTVGSPLSGEADDYKPLCSFVCSHGYCPATACAAN